MEVYENIRFFRALSVLFWALIREVHTFGIHELNSDHMNNVRFRLHTDFNPGKIKYCSYYRITKNKSINKVQIFT